MAVGARRQNRHTIKIGFFYKGLLMSFWWCVYFERLWGQDVFWWERNCERGIVNCETDERGTVREELWDWWERNCELWGTVSCESDERGTVNWESDERGTVNWKCVHGIKTSSGSSKERENVCVWVCACVWVCVCMCVCVCERERDRENVCVAQRQNYILTEYFEKLPHFGKIRKKNVFS